MDSEMFSTEPYYGGETDGHREGHRDGHRDGHEYKKGDNEYLADNNFQARVGWRKGFTLQPRDAKPFHAYYAAYRTGHVFKVLCYMLMFLTAIVIFVQFVTALKVIPSFMLTLKELAGGKAPFTQKENLQWLGASANVIRGDYENKTDSLAEKAAKQAASITDMSAPLPKATFLSPEEELSKKQRQ